MGTSQSLLGTRLLFQVGNAAVQLMGCDRCKLFWLDYFFAALVYILQFDFKFLFAALIRIPI